MIRRLTSARRLTLLGLAALGALAVAAIPRADSHARSANPSPDRQAVREKIIALNGDIELLKLEIEIEHAAILDDIKENIDAVPSSFSNIGLMERMPNSVPVELLTKTAEGMVDDPREIKELGEAVVAECRKELEVAKKKADEEGQRKAVAHLIGEAKKVEAVARRSKLTARKQGYAALARELAGKRLDLEDAELRYRESR